MTDTIVLFRKEHTPEDIKYILALLNSKLLAFRFRGIGKLKSKGTYEYFWNSVSKLPIRAINFEQPSEREAHDHVVTLVDRMLELNKKKHSGKLAPSELDRLEREIAATDEEIDDLVYGLYGITNEERKIIEGQESA